MKKGLIRKGLVFSVIVLFVGVGVTPSTSEYIFSLKQSINKPNLNNLSYLENPIPNPPLEKWDKTFGGGGYDAGNSVYQTSDGGYILTGYYSEDLPLIKTDEDGNVEWIKTFPEGSGESVQQTSDGGYIICGIYSPIVTDNSLWLIKTDENGDLLWDKKFGGEYFDRGFCVQQTSDEGYIITGIYGNPEGGQDYQDLYLIKTDVNGNKLWEKTYGDYGFHCGRFVQQTTDGGYIICGFNYDINEDHNIWLIKTYENGDIEWDKTFGGPYSDWEMSVDQTFDGGYILTGVIMEEEQSGKISIIRTDVEGNELWSKIYGEYGASWGESVQQTNDGGYILTGYYQPKRFQYRDLWLIKTDENGNAPNSYDRGIFRLRILELFPILYRVFQIFY